MLRDNLVGLIEPMPTARENHGSSLALSIHKHQQASDDRSSCLKNPRPAGAESSLTERTTPPFQTEPRQTPVPDRLFPTNSVPVPDNPSQSGKIASIGDAAFSLEVTNGQERKTIEFLVDDDTKVEGKLKVGSQATVEYRSADGKNIAIHVVVTPASSFKAR